MSNRIGGKQGSAYIGTNANQPPNFEFSHRDPTVTDINFSLGDLWLNETTRNKFILVSLKNPGIPGLPKGAYATWVPFGSWAGSGIITLSGSSNPATFVPADAGGNVAMISMLPGMTITGDAALSTITFAAAGAGGIVTQLEGEAGGAVSPTAGGIINVVSSIPGTQFHGNLVANTLTLEMTGLPGGVVRTISGSTATQVSPDGGGNIGLESTITSLLVVEDPPNNKLVLTSTLGLPFLQTLTGNDAVAVPGDVDGNINVVSGTTSLAFTSGPGPNDLTLNVTGGPGTLGQTITTDDTNVVSPDANGNWNVSGDGVNIVTTGTPGTNTINIVYAGGPPVAGVTSIAGASAGSVQLTGDVILDPGTTGFTYTSALLPANQVLTAGTLVVGHGGTGRVTLTAHELIVGDGTNPVNSVMPSLTSGVPLISQGLLADPVFGTAVVAGGGTGTTSFTPYAVVCGGTAAQAPLQNVVGLGSAGQVLTSNGAGMLPSWQAGGTVTSTFSAFLATLNPSVINISGDGTVYQVVFNQELYDDHNDYNNTTGVFTAPVTGKYHFNALLCLTNLPGDNYVSELRLVTTKRTYSADERNVRCGTGGTNQFLVTSWDADLDVGQTAYITMQSAMVGGGGVKQVGIAGVDSMQRTYFSGHLISNTNNVTPASLCSFSAYVNADVANFAGDGSVNIVPYNATFFNYGGYYNTGTYTFTAPSNGVYLFTSNVSFKRVGAGKIVYGMLLWLYKPGQTKLIGNTDLSSFDDAQNEQSATWIEYLNAGDTVTIREQTTQPDHTKTLTIAAGGAGDWRTVFSGYLIAQV